MRNVPKFDPASRLLELTGPKPRVAVAFSGGVDSTVLAHALGRKRRQFASLRLLHVDHGLQAASHDWSRHCARVARGLRLPFVALEATIQRKKGESPEAAARAAASGDAPRTRRMSAFSTTIGSRYLRATR